MVISSVKPYEAVLKLKPQWCLQLLLLGLSPPKGTDSEASFQGTLEPLGWGGGGGEAADLKA